MSDAVAERFAELSSEHYREQVAKVAASLRDLADRVEREGQRRAGGRYDTDSHVYAAQSVVHAVSWGVANLNLSTLISIAETADRTAREAS